ncbi:N6-adenosine-methyltransferase TMT1A-like [Rhineura floridana]|uniref:N6-adenosine-methyltransferase TMT1A-like n=1 Tax=Rhineura floridana TaxID=261503 RepID=UPI002AC85BAF|nr:N6-adenosine-methyltransferase TMT1A-like [Rhineura floridana]
MAKALVFFLRLCFQLLALPIYVLSLLGIWGPFCKKVFFPAFLEKFTVSYNRKTLRQKQELFGNLLAFAGLSGELRLLEIGTGTGSNFQFFPGNCKVICTDPNPHFQRSLAKSIAQNQHLRFDNFLVTPAEDLHQVADSSVDVVVSTLVLCSVRSVKGALSEVYRVLKPGGAFYFLEHVAADRSSWEYFWQQVYFPTWKLLFDGCCLTREIWTDLDKANFSDVKLQRIYVPLHWTPIQPHIIGYAVK